MEWQGYNNGTATNNDFFYYHIPKHHANFHNGRSMGFVERGHAGVITKKVFYVADDKITGVDDNSSGDNTKLILSAVYEY